MTTAKQQAAQNRFKAAVARAQNRADYKAGRITYREAVRVELQRDGVRKVKAKRGTKKVRALLRGKRPRPSKAEGFVVSKPDRVSGMVELYDAGKNRSVGWFATKAEAVAAIGKLAKKKPAKKPAKKKPAKKKPAKKKPAKKKPARRAQTSYGLPRIP